ncbi:XRE family transcriptional regulator [Phaeobacter piscinae]|uniref:XRE family transcriptional regulator n=1 Tax=Phaeobacter piscinae TaxID=1580596 RepID=UPI000693BE30|nr:XRE family transcriptional regulator [Phaeobacter piscinae]UTS79534.1 hypothetical protein OL67_000581 [Phaeobacter piscinae]
MTEISDRILQVRQARNLSRKAFSEAIGIGEGKVQAIETGAQRVDHDTLATIADRFEVDANWLLFGDIRHYAVDSDDPAFVQIPRYTVSAEAGNSGSFVSDPLDITYYAFSLQWIKRRGLDPKELQIIEVKGDSMEPKLREGDLILIDRSRVEPRDGKSFVVRVWDDLVVKHIQIIGKSAISLVSANSVYPPRELKLPLDERDFQIIGQVVASMHEW